MKDPLIYVKHMDIELKKILQTTKGASKSLFLRDENLLDATIRRIEIIGEAAKNVPESFRRKYPGIEWKKIVGMRDKLIHYYA